MLLRCEINQAELSDDNRVRLLLKFMSKEQEDFVLLLFLFKGMLLPRTCMEQKEAVMKITVARSSSRVPF